MTEISEHDTQQLERMLQAIAAFDGELPTLGKVISTLEFLLNALQEASADLRSEVRKRWGVLEEVYAYTLAAGTGKLDAQGQGLVRTNLDALRSQIRNVLGQS